MRSFIFVLLLFIYSKTSFCQFNHIIACENDTVYLYVQNYAGILSWQNSNDTVVWVDITSQSDSLEIIAANNSFYRAVVVDGTCDTIFSDVHYVQTFPAPSTANAGLDQIDISGISFQLQANEPIIGNGKWTLISGVNGTIENDTLFNSMFYGIGAHSYSLVWTIENECRITYDTVIISFRIPQIICNGNLYVHPTDNSGGAAWGCQGIVTNATSETDGSQNTILINTSCTTSGIAAKVCSELNAFGYTDWYLPAKNELACIYNEKAQIGGFPAMSGIVYWTSTETSVNWAATQNLHNGQQSNISQKYGACFVRCVRRD